MTTRKDKINHFLSGLGAGGFGGLGAGRVFPEFGFLSEATIRGFLR